MWVIYKIPSSDFVILNPPPPRTDIKSQIALQNKEAAV